MFTSQHFSAEKEGGFGKSLFYLQNPKKSAEIQERKELSLVFFGELCPSSLGTQLSAKGNHYVGKPSKPITDDSTVKDVLNLRRLTNGSEVLDSAFDNQLASLAEILEMDDSVRALHPDTANCHITEFLAPSDPHSEQNDRSLIKVTLSQKYRVPRDDIAKLSKLEHKRKNLLSSTTADGTGKATDADMQKDTEMQSDAKEIRFAHAIQPVDGLYPLDRLPDHRGTLFQQKKAQLVQLDIRDTDDNLIPPWDIYSKLRPGTIVLVEATLVVWHIPKSKRDKGDKDKKVYQIQGHRLRILADSDEAVNMQSEHNLPLPPPQVTHSDTSPQKKASTSFTSFASPSKKARREY
ncbi:hypothetical protein B0H34DRAFT_854551 [Crassisporium funariophilum]|nr:hypothetical protein B0H34DRAFT_854551 [Crassisporium funariophilum]